MVYFEVFDLDYQTCRPVYMFQDNTNSGNVCKFWLWTHAAGEASEENELVKVEVFDADRVPLRHLFLLYQACL